MQRQDRESNARRASVLMPSDVSSRLGFFDRLAGHAANIAGRAPFFAFCTLLVALWILQGLVTIVATGDLHRFLDDKFQLEINTTTTIITFLLVALLQNSQTREDQATQHKLNAIADALADMMERTADRYDDDRLRSDIRELRLAVGLEEREGTSKENGEGSRNEKSVKV